MRQTPARQGFCGEATRIVRGQPACEAIADELRGVYIDSAREKPVPSMASRETDQPLVAQCTGDGLAGMRVEEGVDRSIEILAWVRYKVTP